LVVFIKKQVEEATINIYSNYVMIAFRKGRFSFLSRYQQM
jgi:hypothetical protein